MDIPSNQYHLSTTMFEPPHYDQSVAHTNAGMVNQHQPPPSSTSQQALQRQQEIQRMHRMQQQQQEQLHIRGQGRGLSHNQPSPYPSDYQAKKYLPPTNIDNHQPRSIQPGYNIAGTNAAPPQSQFLPDEYNYGRNSGPTSLDSSITKSRSAAVYTGHPSPDRSPLTATRRSEQPTQYASEAINEEIRYQADRQRRHQEYERFDSTLQLDPFLICPKCQLQFREGQLPEYRHHIDNCQQ